MCGKWGVTAIAALVALLFPGSQLHAQQQAPAAPATPQQQQQPPVTWERLPHMQLEQMFSGPFQDTVIQRWRDPQTGTTCYLFVPFTVQHSAQTPTGAVQYGPNTIGSISCLQSAPSAPPPAAAAKKPPVHAPARSSGAGEPTGQQ